ALATPWSATHIPPGEKVRSALAERWQIPAPCHPPRRLRRRRARNGCVAAHFSYPRRTQESLVKNDKARTDQINAARKRRIAELKTNCATLHTSNTALP